LTYVPESFQDKEITARVPYKFSKNIAHLRQMSELLS